MKFKQVTAENDLRLTKPTSAGLTAGLHMSPMTKGVGNLRQYLFETMDLLALFSSAFLASTLLPGGSEIALAYLDHKSQHGFWALLITAATGNTLGGMTSYAIGRFIPERKFRKPNFKRAVEYIRRYGSVFLLLSWVPVIGDFLCVAAGWLRVSWWISALLIGLGKTLRYAVILIAF